MVIAETCTVTRENGKSRCNSSFDDVPADHKEARAKKRSMLSVSDHDEEDQ